MEKPPKADWCCVLTSGLIILTRDTDPVTRMLVNSYNQSILSTTCDEPYKDIAMRLANVYTSSVQQITNLREATRQLIRQVDAYEANFAQKVATCIDAATLQRPPRD